MQQIFVATDLSERGDRAVARAFRIAKATGARLTAVTVVDNDLPPTLAEQITAASTAELDRLIASFPASAETTAETVVLRGDPAETVAAYTTTEAADLLIVGRHRSRPFADMFGHTTVERIVELVRCPVLVVSTPPADDYATVLAAIDYSPASAAAVRHARRLAPEARHEGLHVYHVPYRGFMPHGSEAAFLHEAEHTDAGWRRRFAITAPDLPIRLIEGGIQSELTRAISEQRPDLLAIGAHGRSGLAAAMLGSVARTLMREPPCDLLIARPEPSDREHA